MSRSPSLTHRVTNGRHASPGFSETPFIYGTAWKEDETKRLTRLAIEQGFRGIDTANQRKHYFEAEVGEAIRGAIGDGVVAREDLFLQTKFTFQSGQDHRLPYDPAASIADQVEQSFASSLQHLGVDYLDSYILHGPSRGLGLNAIDWDAWRAMEQLHDAGRVRKIGISNVTLEQLQTLLAKTRVAPSYVQNRCYATQAWGRDVRVFCQNNGMVYQAFSLLTANARILSHPSLIEIASRHQRNVSLTLVGDGVELEVFKAQAVALNLGAAVRFVGRHSMQAALSMGRLMILPSRHEAL